MHIGKCEDNLKKGIKTILQDNNNNGIIYDYISFIYDLFEENQNYW